MPRARSPSRTGPYPMSKAGAAVSGPAQCHAAFSSTMPWAAAAARTRPGAVTWTYWRVNSAWMTIVLCIGAMRSGL